jgi:hypothetical protein
MPAVFAFDLSMMTVLNTYQDLATGCNQSSGYAIQHNLDNKAEKWLIILYHDGELKFIEYLNLNI